MDSLFLDACRRAVFRAGVAAVRAGDHATARPAFERYVAARPDDAAGWFNLGNAYYASGDRGRAVWAWFRAVRRNPRDGDARHNIALAAGATAGAFLPPAWSLTSRDVALALSAIWWAAALTAAWLYLRRGRGIGMVAAGSVLGAICALGLAAPSLAPRPTLVAIEETVPLMAGPTLKAEEVDRLAPGTPVRVVEREDGWVRVRTGREGEGWVEASLLAEV
jgi:tetratricopeptide (TPR) repeat protein